MKVINWIIDRLDEPSTWAALTAVLVGLGVISSEEGESLKASLEQLLASGEGLGVAIATVVTTILAIAKREKAPKEPTKPE